MKLFIVVLCYRVVDLTIDCLRSLSKEVCRVPGTKVGVLENGTGGDAASRLQRAIEDNDWGSWCELTVVYPNRGLLRRQQSRDPARRLIRTILPSTYSC